MRKLFTMLTALCGILWAVAQDRPSIVWMRGGHNNAINSLALAPDGFTVASASYDYTVKIWDVRNGRLLRTFVRGQVTEPVYTLFGIRGSIIWNGSNTSLICSSVSRVRLRTMSMTERLFRFHDGEACPPLGLSACALSRRL
jgi:WD40 repeat protein